MRGITYIGEDGNKVVIPFSQIGAALEPRDMMIILYNYILKKNGSNTTMVVGIQVGREINKAGDVLLLNAVIEFLFGIIYEAGSMAAGETNRAISNFIKSLYSG